jgi:protoporphyrinogen oxidase
MEPKVMPRKYDAIIVGAGIGGLIAAAFLSKKEGKKVLVLEKLETIGGRGITLKGEEINKADELAKRFGEIARAKIVRTMPELSEIIARKLLDGYRFETGIHAVTLSNKGRLHYVMNELGISLNIIPNAGAAYYYKDELFDFSKGYPWMTEIDLKELHRVTKDMVTLSLEDAEGYDDMSIREWLSQRTANTATIDFHESMGSLNCSVNNPALVSAGDSIKITRQVVRAGAGMTNAGFGLIANRELPGYLLIAEKLAELVKDCGGVISTSSPVQEILVQNKKAEGVVLKQNGEIKKVYAPVVISNLPITQLFTIISENHFEKKFVEQINTFWSAGAVSGAFGLNCSMTKLKGFVLIPSLIKAGNGFDSDVRAALLQSTNLSPARAPKGKYLVETISFINGEDIQDGDKVNKHVSAMMDFLTKNYPRFEECMEWGLFTASDVLCPVAESPGQVGNSRPAVKSPIEGLYFVGETVGCWGSTVDAVVHSALNCISAVEGKDYLSILPKDMR